MLNQNSDTKDCSQPVIFNGSVSGGAQAHMFLLSLVLQVSVHSCCLQLAHKWDLLGSGFVCLFMLS